MRQLHSAMTGQSSHRGFLDVQTIAPSSIVAAAHICAFFCGTSVRRAAFSRLLGAGFGCSLPSITRVRTRRIFTSKTKVR
ncbi:unannotated protein [freshwater metagenome]|uniref:Unannotated protein n=1 Tax=freshwater metagenome TaxID=449393 RepID=A0A6J7W7Y6_9ZZZZ